MGFSQVFLDLLAAIKDGAVSAGAEYILVQTALAALALGPEPTKLSFQLIHMAQHPLVDFCLLPQGIETFRKPPYRKS